ncbi:hypothetical protein [Gordonia sp. KTR9]|uniref:hypothetical protein n=1 Tax=Gordonia sp. KTR9 TaxID=337191 RepID=UPI0005C9065F|nr:hypothetical protein [Gordonia sp. KTR9]
MSEIVYEIVRRKSDIENGQEHEHVRLSRSADRLTRCVDGESDAQIPEGTTPLAAIQQDERLGVVHEAELSSISVAPDLAPRMPLFLRVRVTGDQLPDRDDWDVTINDVPHAPFRTTSDTLRLLPVDSDLDIEFSTTWASISFCETGSMTSGLDTVTLGLISDSVAVSSTRLDPLVGAPEMPVQLWDLTDDSTPKIVSDWITANGLIDYLTTPSTMLVRLFAESAGADKRTEPTVRWGDFLAGEHADDGEIGCGPSARWELRLDLPPEIVQATLDRLSAEEREYAVIIQGVDDPGPIDDNTRTAPTPMHGTRRSDS